MSKQDRQGVRTATDLERKYHFGENFSEMREMIQKANNAQTAITSHVGDKNNPHGVTAVQVGARPSTWEPSFLTDSGYFDYRNGLLYSGTPTNPVYMAVWDIDDSVDKTQPNRRVRSISAEGARNLMGAAPAGYGLNNDFKSVSSVAELDSYYTCGWVRFINRASDDLLLGYTQAIVRIDSYTNSVGNELACQTAYLFGTTAKSVGIVRRFCFKNNWQPWEWVNPPMDGAEYRTTERCEGKPVYAKRVTYTPSGSLGNSASTTTWSINHGISNFGKLVRISGVLADQYPFPVLGSAGQILQIYTVTTGQINIISYKYVTSGKEVFDLYYTKSTD